MKNLICIIVTFFIFQMNMFGKNSINKDGYSDRQYWVKTLDKIARPVLLNLSEDKLKLNMPIERDLRMSRAYSESCTYLEAFGRLLAGIAPWLELGPDNTQEGQLRAQYIEWSIKSIENAVNPNAADYMNFTKGTQPLVDAAYLCHALLRAPKQLWGNLDSETRENLIVALKSTRQIKPWPNNWLLFSAMVEVTLLKLTGDCQMEPIKYALDKMESWYVGDGLYSDGHRFHNDYYNSFVIHPMMYAVLKNLVDLENNGFRDAYNKETNRYIRYAVQLERMIAPDGTYPVLGRSIIYRFGSFQGLSEIAQLKMLPKQIKPAQVRSALTAMIKKQIENKDTFDKNGWLEIGFVGHQSKLIEIYSSTGSLYLCSLVFLPLGLPSTDNFWNSPKEEWTNVKIWRGDKDVFIDSALHD